MFGFSQGMDARTQLNMFEVFKCRIAQELGPLCPDWFEELTAKAARDEALSDGPEALRKTCVAEAMPRTPLACMAADSQIFCTPRIFKSRVAQSPELLTTDEEMFSPDRGGAGGSKLPWMDTSPCLFRSTKDSQAVKPCNTPLPADYFAASSAKRISESLGAQIDPDVSWTSSLNTPIGMFPTVILTKEEDNTRPVSPSGDTCVIFVRELFPSVPNVDKMTELSPEMPHGPLVQPSEVTGQVDGLRDQSLCLRDQSDCQGLLSLDDGFTDSVWKQTLPDAIQDGEVRSTVASVLDGAEDVLSIFFSSRNSAFRRVKARGRSRRRPTSSAAGPALTPPSEPESGRTEEPAEIAGRTEDVKDAFASSESKESAITQWTPLTLPDVSDTDAGIDFRTVPSPSSATLPSEGLVERQAGTPSPTRGDEGRSLGVVVLAGALAQCDPVLPTSYNTKNAQGKHVQPSQLASPSADSSKQVRCEGNTRAPESMCCQDPGKDTMSESGPVNSRPSDKVQNGAPALLPAGTQWPSSPLEGCSAVTSIKKPPRKFVYSVEGPRIPGLPKHNMAAHSHTTSAPTAPFPGKPLNGKPYGGTMVPSEGVKCEHAAKDDSESKNQCERQDGGTNQEVVPAASDEAENGLRSPSPLHTAVSEELGQEGNPGRTPDSSTDALGSTAQGGLSTATCLAAIRSKNGKRPSHLEPGPKENAGSACDHRDRVVIGRPGHSSAVLTESVGATEMSGLLGVSNAARVTCESQRHDSGYCTAASDVALSRGSTDAVPGSSRGAESRPLVGFETTGYGVISLPREAMPKARVSLDKGAESGLIKNPISERKESQVSTSIERNPISQCNGAEGSWGGGTTVSRHCRSLAQVCAPLQSHSALTSLGGNSPKPGLVSFKTASNSVIRLSPANVLKAKQLFKDIEEERLPEEHTSSSGCGDFKAVGGVDAKCSASKSSAGLMAAPLPPPPSSEQRGSEAYGSLTASQRADVTELCSILEEADSQFEFTQFKQANRPSVGQDEVASRPSCDKEVDPDFLTGIDFDDSFSYDCERQVPRKQPADTTAPNDKLTANPYREQHGQESIFKTKAVEISSFDSADKNEKCTDGSPAERPSTSAVAGRNHDSGNFVAFSSASGKKITVSREILRRASKVFEDLDLDCVPPQNPVPGKGTNSSRLNVLSASVTEVQRAGSQAKIIPETHVTFNTPKNSVINPNPHIKKIGLSPIDAISSEESCLEVSLVSNDRETLKEGSIISESNLSPPTSVLNLAGGEKVFSGKAVSKQPKAVCTSGHLQSDAGVSEKSEISDDRSSGVTIARHGVGFRTARGTAVTVAERFLSKAREVFADLEENPQSAHVLGRQSGGQGGKEPVIQNEEPPDRCAVTSTGRAETTPEKCSNGKDTHVTQRTCVTDYVVDKPDGMPVENEVDVNSVEEKVPSLNSETNFGRSAASVNTVSKEALLEAETSSSERACVAGSCEITVAPDAASGNVSTFNPRGNCGFSTASGKKVTVSKRALQHAESLLNECTETKTPEPAKNSTLSDGRFSSSTPRDECGGGFRTASGKGVSISPKALEQAKSVFRNCDDAPESEMTEAVKGERAKEQTRASLVNPAPTERAVSASGKGKVSVPAKALLEAKTVFKGCDYTVDSAVGSGPEEESSNANWRDASGNPGKTHCGFSTAGGKRVCVSEKALLKASALLKECDEKHHLESDRLEFTRGSTEDLRRENSGGFSTAGGKGVSISAKALREAKALFKACDDTSLPEVSGEVTEETVSRNSTSNRNDPEKRACGFSTASGKKVSVSKTALLKAAALLNKCCEVESEVEPRGTLKAERAASSVQIPPRESGCGSSPIGLAQSRPPASAQAVCEREAVSKNCPGDTIVAEDRGNHVNVKNISHSNPGKHNVGFTTASGNQVSVSAGALEEAKAKFKDCSDGSDGATGAEMKVGGVKVKSGRQSPDNGASGVNSTAHGKGVSASEAGFQSGKSAPAKIEPSSCQHVPQGALGRDRAAVHQSAPENREAPVRPRGPAAVPVQEPSELGKVAVEPEARVTGQGQGTGNGNGNGNGNAGGAARGGGPSLLDLRSLGLGHCSVTQQRYLEQEAMACTRALLEDEDLDERGLPGAPSEPPNTAAGTRSSEAEEPERSKGNGKRLKAEDFSFTDQPPLKRRLLADFDQSDCGKWALLAPVKSSPNVTLRDRRIFRYNVPLQPNVTKPPGDEKSVPGQRQRKAQPQIVAPDLFLRDGKPANPGGAVFMPPFRKCPEREAQIAGLPEGSRRLPSVFVPPFRKGQANAQPRPSSSETPVTPAVFTPPSKKESVPAPDPGSDGKASVLGLFAGGAVTDDPPGEDGGPCPVNSNVPGEGEAVGEGPVLAPTSPGEQEANPSDARQTLQNLQLQRDLQDMRIRKKRRQVIRPQPGSLLLAKTSGVTRLSLRSAVGGRCPVPHTEEELYACGVRRGVSRISSASAESFRFCCRDFFRGEALSAGAGVQLADGGLLIPSDGGTVGKEEFHRALCDTPGVDPKLISEGWLYNHYRWVVWKRASMERSFPSVLGSHCLTPEQVLLQLKYRYDVEVDQSRRSALRKIMERDDTPAKTLVLCVCGVAPAPPRPAHPESRTSPGPKAGSSPGGVVWVTDGWYAIKALLDAPLTAMLLKGRLAIGGKVVTHGAELVGSQDACPPLEAPESLMLKISANSTRTARWDAKLGFHRDPRPFRLPLSSLYSGGGPAGCVDVVVLRSYPTQWMEKKAGGVFVFRGDRAEQREARRHSDSKHKAMERLFAKVQAQFEKDQEDQTRAKSRRRRLSRQEIEALQDGEELDDAVESDPVHLESCLSEQQLATLSSYRESAGQERQARLQERFRQALAEGQEAEGACSDRDVAPLWKLSVCDSRDRRSVDVYLLSIWRPSMELQSLLREGCRFKVYQVATSEGKKRAGSAVVQLTATKRTQFQHVPVSPECLSELFQPRACVSFRALRGPGFRALCGEVDVVGYVLSIADRHGPSPALYLVDEHQDFACVRISGGLAQLALEELVKPLTLLALSNLRLHHQSPAHVPALYAGELTLFSAHPKEPHLQGACAHLRSIVQGDERFFRTAEEKLSGFVPSTVPSSSLSPRGAGPAPNMANGQIPQQPVRTPGLFTPVSQKPPLPVSASEDRDPKTLKRKRGLDFLSRIPSPPPLNPLWGKASPSVKSTFNPPRRSETPQPLGSKLPPPSPPAPPTEEAEWVNDEELAMINTQALLDGLAGP